MSQVAGREGVSFASPIEQRERIEAACEREGMELVTLHEELDVSGGTPLAKRKGLRAAVESVEAREADVVVAAYFDRLVRSLKVQEEVVSRVEAAGGRVLALDVGQITGGTASQWLSGTLLGAVNEYQRRSAGERIGEAQVRAVARGVVPWASIPTGYVRGPDGVLVPDALLEKAATVRQAFQLRVEGATIREVRAFLTSHGIRKSYHGVMCMLKDRLYLGEIHFGELVNLDAHEPLIDRDLFERVQRVRVPKGKRPQSDRLLARLGVLRCGTCGARMVVGTQTQNGRRYPFYRCPPTGDCPQRQAISAEIAEQTIVDATRQELSALEGSASVEADARAATIAAERAQGDLDAAIRAFAGMDDEAAARERLGELAHARDVAKEEAHRLSRLSAMQRINIGRDWDRLTLAEKRTAIKTTVARATVSPGKGASRISVHLLREKSSSDGIGE